MNEKNRSVMKIPYLTSIFLLAVAGLLPATGAVQAAQKSSLLEKVRKDNLLVVGVKNDFAPFGYLDSEGRVQGFEVELAERVAKEIGVGFKAVGVTTGNRFQRLEQGAVDLVIATAADTRERRKVATAIEPGYFGAGVDILLRPEIAVAGWQDLRGRRICALQGAYFNKGINSRYVLDLRTYKSIGAAQSALKQGDCVGFLYSETAIQGYLKKPEFQGYRANLEATLIVPWAAFLPRSEKGTDFEHLVGNIIAGLHREGYLVELQKKWGLASSKFLRENQVLWSRSGADGKPVCQRGAGGEWPVECREKTFVTSADVQGINAVFRRIEETTGLNFSFAYDVYDRERYLNGILISVLLIVISTLLTLGLGIAGAKILTARRAAFRAVSGVGTFVIGSTPPLLSMYLVFFGLGALVSASYGLNLSAFWVAVICLSIYHGAIVAKTIQDSVKLKQADDPDYRFRVSRVPEILETASVGVNGAITNLVKASMVASAIAVPELLSATIGIIADQGNTNVMMILLLMLFLGLTTAWLSLVRHLQSAVIRKYGNKHA